MNRLLLASAAALTLLFAGKASAVDHPKLHHAVHDIREAIAEIEGAKHTHFDKHKEAALKDLRHALLQVDRALVAVGEPFPKNFKVAPDIYKDYKDHKHLRHAEHAIDAAIKELKESKKFGDHKEHKEKAIEALEKAHRQVKILIKSHP